MQSTSVRLEGWQIDGLEQLSKEADTNMAHFIRAGVTDILRQYEDGLPDHVSKEAAHEQIIRENKPAMRELHFKQRSWEYVRDMVFNHDGKIKRFPPDPEHVDSVYFDNLRRQVDEEFADERADRYHDHIERLSDWYEMMHPQTDHGSKREQVIEAGVYLMRHDSRAAAREAVKQAVKDGAIQDKERDEVFDAIRREFSERKWLHDWNEAARGGSA